METTKLIFLLSLLILVIVLTRRFHARKIEQAYRIITNDLKDRGAFDPDLAVDLAFTHKSALHMGMRDHRPMALEHLRIEGIVDVTETGKYYLTDKSL